MLLGAESATQMSFMIKSEWTSAGLAALPARGTEGSNPLPSCGESSELSSSVLKQRTAFGKGARYLARNWRFSCFASQPSSGRGFMARVLPLERLRWISFSHFEADECGALNEFLAVAPNALPLYGRLLAMLSVNDIADREARILGDSEITAAAR